MGSQVMATTLVTGKVPRIGMANCSALNLGSWDSLICTAATQTDHHLLESRFTIAVYFWVMHSERARMFPEFTSSTNLPTWLDQQLRCCF